MAQAPPPPPPPSGYPPPPYQQHWQPPTPIGPAPGLAYGGFWIRFLAWFIDSLIVALPLGAIFIGLVLATSGNIHCTEATGPFGSRPTCTGLESLSWLIPSFVLVSLALPALYFVYLWSHGGQSLGQKLCGLHVVDASNGGAISTGRALGRYVGYLVSGYVLYIGLIWAAFDPRKQGWHDKMANTFVVRRI